MNLKIIISAVIIFCSSFSMAWAQENIKSYNSFASIPFMDLGRFIPLDTYARNLLIQFSGRDSYEGQSAIAWLAHLLFSPFSVKDERVFLINNPEIAVALNIPVESSRRYSAIEILKAYPKLVEVYNAASKIPAKERSIVENEIIRIAQNINLYADLSHSMFFAFPQQDFTITSKEAKSRLDLPANRDEFSFMDIVLKADKLGAIVQGLQHQKRSDVTPDEIAVMKILKQLFEWSNTYKNMPLTVVPASGGWMSPWDAVGSGLGNEEAFQLVSLWHDMAISFAQGHDNAFDRNSTMYLRTVSGYLTKQERGIFDKFPLELIYNAAKPFLWAKVFYILAFIFFVVSFISSRLLWYRLAACSVVLGFLPHTLGLMARIIIMARPPVSNLYETFIFVGFIAVLLGLAIEYFNKQWLGIVTAAISGTVLLFIAGRYSAEGDTLKMLVAVLNSNFWLATHVTTITMGYGATCVAGVLGHIWLLQAAVGKKTEVLEKTHRTILAILGVALPLTFLGTNLGGIWADQSWGRFWGWDPKENGALMIVLWTTMVLHAKVSNLIAARGLAVGAVLGMMVVVWAWFGVNLLSVGLHSYGFTSGIATALEIYAAGEVVFLLMTLLMIQRRQPRVVPSPA